MAKRVLLMLLAVAAASAGRAYAGDDPACAKYQDPLAYNACLASHGPKANDLATLPRPAQEYHAPAPVRAAPVRQASPRSGWGWRHAARARGRVRMVFQVK